MFVVVLVLLLVFFTFCFFYFFLVFFLKKKDQKEIKKKRLKTLKTPKRLVTPQTLTLQQARHIETRTQQKTLGVTQKTEQSAPTSFGKPFACILLCFAF